MVELKPAGGEVRAPLTFIVRQDTKPNFKSSALTGGDPEVFFETENRSVTIHDMRALAKDPALDRDGFELRRWPTAVDDLYDDAALERVYDGEIEALLKHATGAGRAVVFDRTRRSDAPQGAVNPDGARGPADRVHVDYTTVSGPVRAGDALGAGEVERILAAGGRIVQINVWRPITGPVERTPLALAAADSIAPGDLIAVDQVFPARTGEIYMLAHAPRQRWYWAPAIERDEVLLIKGWDSLDDGRARFTPHGAFRLPGQDETGRTRESIEIRAYVIYDG